MKRFSHLLFTLVLCLWASTATAITEQPTLLPDGDAVLERMRVFVDEVRDAPGVIVGLRDAQGRRLYAYGRERIWRSEEIDTGLRFEIGSITKGFNGLLLADMIGRGEVRADQTIGELVPEDVVLAPEIAAITLEDLATHHSGLPRLAPGGAMRGMSDPYRGSTAQGLFDALAGQAAERVVKNRGRFEYSNFGVSVLGQLLARRAQLPWEELLRERVLEPLGIADAGFLIGTPPDDQAPGHRGGRAVRAWTMDAYAPTGGLVMSADSLLDLGESMLAGEPGFVADAMRPRQMFGSEGQHQVGLGWFQGLVGEHRVVWHNGGMSGTSSYFAVVPEQGWVVVVLANGFGQADPLGEQIIDPAQPLEVPPTPWIRLALTLAGIIALPLCLGWGIRKAKTTAIDRVRALDWVLTAGVGLLLLRFAGAWTRVPFALWGVVFAVTTTLAGVLLWQARREPWLLPGRWRYARCLSLMISLVLVAVGLLLVMML